MKTILFVLLLCVPILAQTSTELRQKYGAPTSEIFVVRPNVVVTLTYAKNGEPCELLIEPQRPATPIKSSTTRLTLSVLNKIIDELVPSDERGKPLMAGFVNMRCLPNDDCWGTSSTYEKVSIYYNSSGKDEYRYATIQWRGKACQK